MTRKILKNIYKYIGTQPKNYIAKFAKNQSPAKRGSWRFLIVLIVFFSVLTSQVLAQEETYLTNFSSFLNNIILTESINFNTTQNGAIISTASPLSSNPSDPYTGIIIYEVQEGDTLIDIAKRFNISVNTIIWTNNLKGSLIKIGDKLEILPVSGVKHIVKEGDLVAALAKKYRTEAEKIIDFNALNNEADIYIGDLLIIPDGEMPVPKPKPASVNKNYLTLTQSYFIVPIANGYRSQGLHRFNAVDFAGDCGTPILAAAEGTVIEMNITNSKSRWANHGYGNYIKIVHPNGVVTLYAHLFNSIIHLGQTVAKGQQIASMGGQPRTPGAGKSTGCHLHFEVRGARNPFAYGSIALKPN